MLKKSAMALAECLDEIGMDEELIVGLLDYLIG